MRFLIRASLILALSSIAFAQALTYARSKGAVSDFAGKLSPQQVSELTAVLENYERQTSIEMVVVIADSLQGQSAKDYATGIGNSWGVGKAGQNNGIVLLWAPNERAYSLRIAEGLSSDLTDADATEITQSQLLPNFRRERYYEGLKETVDAVIQRLGTASWEQRLKLRHEQGPVIPATTHHDTGQSIPTWLVPSLFVAMGIFAVVFVIVQRFQQRSSKLREMAEATELIAKDLRTAEKNASQVRRLLDSFGKQMPEQDLTSFRNELATQPDRTVKIRAELAKLDVADVTCYDAVIRAKERAGKEANLLSKTQRKLNEIEKAKTQSQVMLQQLGKGGVKIDEVRDESRKEEVNKLLSGSRSLYDQAYRHSSMSMLDWLIIYELLSSSHRQAQEALQVSQAEPHSPPATVDIGSSGGFGAGSSDYGGGGGFSGGSGSDGSY